MLTVVSFYFWIYKPYFADMRNLMVVLTQTPPVKRIFYLEEKKFFPVIWSKTFRRFKKMSKHFCFGNLRVWILSQISCTFIVFCCVKMKEICCVVYSFCLCKWLYFVIANVLCLYLYRFVFCFILMASIFVDG